MKIKLAFALLLLSLLACHKHDEVSLKNIISVNAFDDLAVAYGTEFSAIPLPTQVTVTYSDNTTGLVPVTFSPLPYNKAIAGVYALEGTLTMLEGTTNLAVIKASVNVTVLSLKLKSVKQDGDLLFEYFYDIQNRLEYFKEYGSDSEFHYTYDASNKVTERLRKHAGFDYPEKYFYHSDGTLDRVEFYSNDVLGQTLTYTYSGGKISRYDNSEQTPGLKFRMFDYDAQDNIIKVTFDVGNSWNYTYVNNKKLAIPLVADLADPQNQTSHPVSDFTFVELSSYTATFTYNAFDYPTEEIRTYPGNDNSQTTLTYTYQ